jgi:hypothetical protein
MKKFNSFVHLISELYRKCPKKDKQNKLKVSWFGWKPWTSSNWQWSMLKTEHKIKLIKGNGELTTVLKNLNNGLQ